MRNIWYLTPSGPLADAVVPHLDRAGVSFTLLEDSGYNRTFFLGGNQTDAREIARRIIEADGKEFVPEHNTL